MRLLPYQYFYDIHVLSKLYGYNLNHSTLHDALIATSQKRGSVGRIKEAEEVFADVKDSAVMQKLWSSYQKKFSYAQDLNWEQVVISVCEVYQMMK